MLQVVLGKPAGWRAAPAARAWAPPAPAISHRCAYRKSGVALQPSSPGVQFLCHAWHRCTQLSILDGDLDGLPMLLMCARDQAAVQGAEPAGRGAGGAAGCRCLRLCCLGVMGRQVKRCGTIRTVCAWDSVRVCVFCSAQPSGRWSWI